MRVFTGAEAGIVRGGWEGPGRITGEFRHERVPRSIDRKRTFAYSGGTLEENQPDDADDGDPRRDIGKDKPIPQPTVCSRCRR